MDRLWGEVAPVPERQLHIVDGEEQITAGGRTFEVAYTPGHASHHVSYFDAASGIAFVGDTAGVCIDGGLVLPPAPPPGIHPQVWGAAVGGLQRGEAAAAFLNAFWAAQGVGAPFS